MRERNKRKERQEEKAEKRRDVFRWRDKETGKEERQNRNQHNAEGRIVHKHTNMQKENILA